MLILVVLSRDTHSLLITHDEICYHPLPLGTLSVYLTVGTRHATWSIVTVKDLSFFPFPHWFVILWPPLDASLTLSIYLDPLDKFRLFIGPFPSSRIQHIKHSDLNSELFIQSISISYRGVAVSRHTDFLQDLVPRINKEIHASCKNIICAARKHEMLDI